MTTQLRLAAIIALLSSSALRGTTASKNAALCMHLETLLRQDAALDPNLTRTLKDTLQELRLITHFRYCPAHDLPNPHAATTALH